MVKKTKNMSAIEWTDKRIAARIDQQDYKDMVENTHHVALEKFVEDVHSIYERAIWIDANIKGVCVVDPYFKFHFYEEEDAVAFKLRWE